MKTAKYYLQLWLLVLGLSHHSQGCGADIFAEASLPVTGTIAITQQVKLTVDIFSRQDFARSSQIRWQPVAGLVIEQKEPFSTRYTAQRQGHEYFVQQWELLLTPQAPGPYRLPALQIDVWVRDDDGQVALKPTAGIQSNSIEFSASIPEAMQGIEHWFAATAVTVERSFEPDLLDESSDKPVIGVGDALSRTIHIWAQDSAPRMLPTFNFRSYQGLSAYQKPAQTAESVNRGRYTAEKTIRVDYLVEEDGRYQFPARQIHWWDTVNQRHQVIELDEVLLQAGENPTLKPFVLSAEEQQQQSRRRWLMGIATGLALLLPGLAALGVYRYWQRPHVQQAIALRRLLKAACAEEDLLKQQAMFYRYFDYRQSADYDAQLQSLLAGISSATTRSGMLTQLAALQAYLYAEQRRSSVMKADAFWSSLLAVVSNQRAQSSPADGLRLNPAGEKHKA